MRNRLLLFFILFLTAMGAMAQENVEPLETIYQKFTFNMFNKVADSCDGQGIQNVTLSPLSAQIAVSMLQNGAAGNTLAQIREVMGTTAYTNQQVNEYNQQLVSKLTYRPPFEYNPYWGMSEEEAKEQFDTEYPIVETANALWTKPHFIHVYDSYKDLLANYYDAEVDEVDFGTQEGVDAVNGWVDEKTHHLIPSVLEHPDDFILMMLVNALYFKGAWNTPFDPLATHKADFHQADGKTVEVDMMKTELTCRSRTTEKFTTVTLPYGQTWDFSMTIFLPTNSQTFPQLTYEDWITATDTNNESVGDEQPWKDLALQMPKFYIEGTYTLTDIFKEMGMVDAFGANADFSLLSSDLSAISKIYQLGKIVVNEKGTEAAAVTVIQSDNSPHGITYEDFIIDRPFFFTIESSKTNTILFVGRMKQIPGMAGSSTDIHGTPATSPALPVSPQLYDLAGRRLNGLPQKGIYIQNGRKFVVK
ncbi:MAG: serpin family protein [Prevotella sp.]|nr:serpin family protein [Prevotella sp.]